MFDLQRYIVHRNSTLEKCVSHAITTAPASNDISHRHSVTEPRAPEPDTTFRGEDSGLTLKLCALLARGRRSTHFIQMLPPTRLRQRCFKLRGDAAERRERCALQERRGSSREKARATVLV